MSEHEVAELGAGPLHAWTASAVERGRAAWPELVVSRAELARLAALRLSTSSSSGGGGRLDELDPCELYLAAACVRGDGPALVQFRARYFEPLIPSLQRMGMEVCQCDDIWQTLCRRLLVGEAGEAPRIVRYVGAGQLAGLVRVAATRIALNWLEQAKRRAGGDSWIERMQAGGSDPELHAMKHQHRADLKQELEAAVEGLNPRDRMMLRMHLVERLGIDAIARLCSMHRATAARSIVRARRALTETVRTRLIARWNVADADLQAVRTLIDSQVDLSLERLLARG
jgi:RNA polymerase sigma-70 factor (ECF subfamily)